MLPFDAAVLPSRTRSWSLVQSFLNRLGSRSVDSQKPQPMVQSQAGRSVSIASEFYPCTHCTQTGGLRLMRHDRQLILQQMYRQDKCNRECVINKCKCKCETHHRQRQGIYEVLHTGGAICGNSHAGASLAGVAMCFVCTVCQQQHRLR